MRRGKVASGSGCEGSLLGREASCNCCLVAVEERRSLDEDDTSLEREWFSSWAAEWLLGAWLGAPWGRGWRLAAWEPALSAADQRCLGAKTLKEEKLEKEEMLEREKVKEPKEPRLLAVDQRGAEAV